MKEFDEREVAPKAFAFMKKAQSEGKPFFVWFNTTRMHLYTRLSDKWRYAAENETSEFDVHGSGMLQHDHDIGLVLDFLKTNGMDDNTIVWYSTDNGPEHSSWPHGGTSPFRGEKMSTYEGGIRVVSMVRWPAVIKPAQTMNGIQAHMDMFTTLAAAAGVNDVAADVMADKKQYIDGVNNLSYWKGETTKSKRDHLFYYYESKLMAVRMNQWKWHFATKEDYYANVVPRTAPLIFNLRTDPFESYDSKDSYGHLLQKMSWMLAPMGELMNNHLATLAAYPPVQGGKSFDMSNVVEDFLQSGQQ
jgi:arylsulfatase